VRKQKTDRRDAGHILKLLMERRFPRLWQPSAGERDLRQLLIHRHRLVEIRTRVKNGLQHLALNRGVQKHRALWSGKGRAALEKLALTGWAGRRREDLLAWLTTLDEQVSALDAAVLEAAKDDARARLLMSQPGVGPVTALALAVTIDDVSRFASSGQVASYLGLIPREHSSGGHQRPGSISKQDNRFVRRCWWRLYRPRAGWTRDFANSIRRAATTRPREWPRWRRQDNWLCDSTGCSDRTLAIRRSPISRAARGCPWQGNHAEGLIERSRSR